MQLTAHPIDQSADAVDVAAAADILAEILVRCGIRRGFGVTGGPIARFVHAVEHAAGLRWVTSRTEGAAVYEALGSWAVTGEPALIVVTNGPGLFATRQALEVAKREGFRGVVVSPRTPARVRGSHAAQGSETFVSFDYLLPGCLFNLVVALESVAELVPLAAHLAAGLSGRAGFLAHIMIPSDLLVEPTTLPRVTTRRPGLLGPDPRVIDDAIGLLGGRRFSVVVGRGARADAELVRTFVEQTGAPTVSTPGAKGVIDERSRYAWGVIGIGGQRETLDRLRAFDPEVLLVLCSRMSDSSVTPDLVTMPTRGLIQVDRDALALGRAWDVPTMAVHSELRPFLEAMLAQLDRLGDRQRLPSIGPVPAACPPVPEPVGCVDPRALMAVVQKLVVDGSDAPVFVEVGTAWPWVVSCLRFSQARRLFLETAVGSMSAANGSAVGAAIGLGAKSVSITGDWAMDMLLAEIRTAVDQNAPVVWIILNNSAGQMVLDGDRMIWGHDSISARFQPGNYAAVARAFGARGAHVTKVRNLSRYLVEAMSSTGPYVLDVCTDLVMPPYEERFLALQRARDTGRGPR